MKAYHIIPGRLLQSARLAQLNTARKLEFIAENKILAVFNFWHTADEDVRAWLPYYHHYPMPDGKRFELNPEFMALVAKGVQYLRAGAVVLSHCYGGRNRSGLFSALVAKRLLGISGEMAVRLVQEGRPHSLVNASFVKLILEDI